MRVKIYTRSFDLKLYRHSRGLFDGIDCIDVVRLTDQSADGYFYTMLRDEDCDIAVNIDEDAFVIDPQAVNDLVQMMISEGYANIGCPDAGEGLPRNGNARVTNPFFNILNIRLIRSKFNVKDLKAYKDYFEPYYPFYLWLADNFPILYLPSVKHGDGITTILRDPQGRCLCMHSWYARFYSMPDWIVRRIQKDQGMQKARIDALIHEAYAIRGIAMPQFGTRDRLAFAGNKIVRWAVKIPQRISRWPSKLRRKIIKSK